MKKFYFLAALVAGTALTSCTSEDDLALSPPEVNNVEDAYAPILFSSVKNNITRADITGADAAALLNNKFVVTGFKGAATATPASGSIVFDNYSVEWTENTAYTTESNSSNWEYVDKALIPHAETNGITKQTIKYWDYSKNQYDFIAWAVGKTDEGAEITAIYDDAELTGHQVRVSAIAPNSKTNGWPGDIEEGTAPDVITYARPSYTFEGKAEDLSHCYISDIVTVFKGNVENPNDAPTYNVVQNGYNKAVTLRFRQLGTKVRIGLYETVPGYSVKDVKFYTAAKSEGKTDVGQLKPTLFTTTENEIFTEGTYTVYFPTVDTPLDADNNQAHIKFAPKDGQAQTTTIDWNNLDYTIRESGESSDDEIYLGRTSNTASFAGDPKNNYYQVFLPNQNGTNLNLRVNYKLEAIDGCGEIIEVKGATAQVPLIYAQWKPGYAYTYLFKISDKTNGHTGIYDPTNPDDTSVNSDPAGLFPITFDAVVVNAEEDKTQETITLVATPSITTYQNGSKVVNNNEYTVLTSTDPKITGEIYVTVNDGKNGGEAKYVEVTNIVNGASVAGYYTKDGDNYVACAASDKAVDGTTYYKKMLPSLADGELVVLTDKVNLYIIPAGTTEAEVIDALQCQDEDKDQSVTIKGRNGITLTEPMNATDNTKKLLEVTNEVTYGADGNTIDVATGKAAKFVPSANTTYAFVYTKTAASGTDQVIYQAVGFDNTDVITKYRYGYKKATPSYEDTADESKNVYDAQKGVNYYTKSGEAYNKVAKPFIGQGVSNLYLDDHGTEIASGYAVTGTDYYYTTDGGQNYTKAVNIAYDTFGGADDIYTRSGSGTTADPYNYSQKPTTVTAPEDGIAYYKKAANSETYTYCVILPQQTSNWYEIDTNKNNCVVATETEAVPGQTYFDKYTKNNGEYYTKVIKIAAAN